MLTVPRFDPTLARQGRASRLRCSPWRPERVAGTAMGATLSDEQRDLLVESNINDDLSTQAVAQGRRLEEQASHASRELQPGQLAFPNGRIVNVEDLDLDHAFQTLGCSLPAALLLAYSRLARRSVRIGPHPPNFACREERVRHDSRTILDWFTHCTGGCWSNASWKHQVRGRS